MTQMMSWPDDDDGDALRRLETHGDDFTISRDIDFSVVFADQPSAELFVKRITALGYRASVEAEAANPDTWDVLVVKQMTPSYVGIRDFESLLQSFSEPLGG